jgi:WD40 repeat protein
VAFISDRIVAAGDAGVVRIWNDGTLQHEYLNGSKPVLALAVSPDRKQILSGDSDGEIGVWSVATGRTLHVLQGHAGGVNTLAFTQHGRQAVSGGADGVVRLWQLPFSD